MEPGRCSGSEVECEQLIFGFQRRSRLEALRTQDAKNPLNRPERTMGRFCPPGWKMLEETIWLPWQVGRVPTRRCHGGTLANPIGVTISHSTIFPIKRVEPGHLKRLRTKPSHLDSFLDSRHTKREYFAGPRDQKPNLPAR